MDEETKKQETEQEATEADAVETPQSAGKQNMNAALTYAFGWITGLIFLLTEKDDEFIRFHAAQSIVVFGAINVLMFVPVLNVILGIIVTPLSLILWLFLMYKAYNNEMYKLPVAGDFAEQLKDSVGK